MKNKRTYKVIELERPDWQDNKYTIIDDLGKKVYINFLTKEEAQKRCDEYNSTYYLEYYSNDEILDYFNSIDFKPLLEKINSLVGLELTYDISLRKNKTGIYNFFKIENKENLVNSFPILSLAWREFKVATFNASIICDKKTGKLELWCTIHFTYEHHGAGTNSAEILTAWSKDGKWIFEINKEIY